jgi:hypothetical protein
MRSRPLPRFVLLAAVAGCWSGACATGSRQPRADTGSVTVGVRTDAADAAKLTFRVTIEPAGIASAIKADAGVFTNGRVPAGTHVVRLVDVPSRCRVAGGPERTITISPPRRNAVVRFEVDCR